MNSKLKFKMTEEEMDYFVADVILPAFEIKDMTTVLKDKFKDLLRKKGYVEIKDEPLIVHNVMSYKGKNHLAQKAEAMRCTKCALQDITTIDKDEQEIACVNYFKCLSNCYWKSFNGIEITDELAYMRKDIGDIYLKGSLQQLLILRGIELINGVIKALIYVPKNPLDKQLQFTSVEHLRLATAEELQEYFNRENIIK